MAACSFGNSTPSFNHSCTDKVQQEITTNLTVKGVWNCLTPRLQGTLKMYADDHLVVGADDRVFTDGTNQKIDFIVSSKYFGEQDNIVTYTVIVKRTDGTLA